MKTLLVKNKIATRRHEICPKITIETSGKTLVLVGLNRNESESKLSIVNMAGLR